MKRPVATHRLLRDEPIDDLSDDIAIDGEEGAFPPEVPISEFGTLTRLLSSVSTASGEMQALPPHFSSEGTLTLRPADANAMAVMEGAPAIAKRSLDSRQLGALSVELHGAASRRVLRCGGGPLAAYRRGKPESEIFSLPVDGVVKTEA